MSRQHTFLSLWLMALQAELEWKLWITIFEIFHITSPGIDKSTLARSISSHFCFLFLIRTTPRTFRLSAKLSLTQSCSYCPPSSQCHARRQSPWMLIQSCSDCTLTRSYLRCWRFESGTCPLRLAERMTHCSCRRTNTAYHQVSQGSESSLSAALTQLHKQRCRYYSRRAVPSRPGLGR